jgi:YD repeat-containing protein
MQRLIIPFLCLGLLCELKAQIGPKENSEEELRSAKVKKITTFYYETEDTSKSNGRLLMQKEFDENFKLQQHYLYTFWDAVSYDHTTTYQYDDRGNLLTETRIQKILNLGPRDSSYIAALGSEPINTKTDYVYNDKNQCTMELVYTYKEASLPEGQKPDQMIFYEYKNDKLVKEKSLTPTGAIIYENYEAKYSYNGDGLLIRKDQSFVDDSKQTTTYSYDSKKQLTEEKRIDSKMPLNDRHLKFEYDSLGRKTIKWRYSKRDSKWIELEKFKYNNNGGRILENDDETTYTYYSNGLIRQELWISSKGNGVVNFITTYEFFPQK